MGRAGYFGCLVVLGVLVLSLSCLAVFGATGAITAEPGPTAVAAAEPRRTEPARPPPTPAPPTDQVKPGATSPATPPGQLEPTPSEPAVAEPGRATQPAAGAATPLPVGTIPPKAPASGPEGNIAQRLDREAVGGGLKLRALGAAKTTQGERAVLAIYVRAENEGTEPVRLDPAHFSIVDRGGTRYPISKAVEAQLPAIELAPRAAPGEPGKSTEGNLTFELPRAAAGLALVYEPPGAPSLRIPLPPEFG